MISPREPDWLPAKHCLSADRVVDVTPTSDGVYMPVHRREVRSHRHDGDVASSGRAPCRDVVRPLIVAAAVLLDRFESEFIIRPSKFGEPGLDLRLDRNRLRLGSAREHKSVADPGRPFIRD